MESNKQIMWWLLQKIIELEKLYELEQLTPDTAESIDVMMSIMAKRELVDELLEFIGDN